MGCLYTIIEFVYPSKTPQCHYGIRMVSTPKKKVYKDSIILYHPTSINIWLHCLSQLSACVLSPKAHTILSNLTINKG